jgi:signal transduction histidine kinase
VLLIIGVVLDQVVIPGLFGGTSLGGLFQAALTMVIPTAVGIAILRHRLLDIDVVLSRALSYGALTAILLVAYVLAVNLLSSPLEPGRPVGASLFATAVVAVAFAPLRQRIQQAVDRWLFGQRSDPYAVVSRLGERLGSTGTPEAILPAVVETVAQTLRLPYAAIELVDDENLAVASFGTPAGELVRFPLGHQAQQLGSLVVGWRTRHDPISASERRLLEDLARLVSVVAYSVRVSTDLQRSRERLVAAREEERRRLRRELHDGLGPALAGVAFRVGAVQSLVAANRDEADAQLATLRADVKAVTQEIRRVVEGLRPPALDELGLVGAIEHVVNGFGLDSGSEAASSLAVTVEAPQPERLHALPAAVEVAAYRIVSEALTNVFRHARATACNVRLVCGEALEIEVVDNGTGFSSPADFGVGVGSMRERAEELGGRCAVESLSGTGTTVRARIPL